MLGVVAAALAAAPSLVSAFCGFYVAGADQKLYNNATQVVLMRHGTRTVLSMQNNYQGPAEDFAMVVPVPVVLQEENVKTLPREVFDRVDTLASPRLVEYWEEDPCAFDEYDREKERSSKSADMSADKPDEDSGGHGVTVEAQFTVGEYEIVILSAKEATGLDSWLREQGYKISDGAAPLLEPYVQGGWKFFVAKVDVSKVTFDSNKNAMLSPLRFYYDSEDFTLPVRLGLMNAKDKQDLIVHILADRQRYEAQNRENVTIPTNLDVRDETRDRFGEFYAALFDRTVEKNPGAVVTEYSWDASSCDPCPTPALDYSELMTLGQDVLFTPMPAASAKPDPKPDAKKQPAGDPDDPLELIVEDKPTARRAPPPPPPSDFSGAFVLTRLHVRYDASDMKDDLVFKTADPIVGGREQHYDGKLEERSRPDSMNNFQGRYIIRHAWTGAVKCAAPAYGRWGGPPGGTKSPGIMAAKDTAFAPRGQQELEVMVAADVPEIGVRAKTSAVSSGQGGGATTGAAGGDKKESKDKKKGCGCDTGSAASSLPLLAAVFGMLWLFRRRRRETL